MAFIRWRAYPLAAYMQFYHVTNWERFQHYKDRNPPWIKLHFELLSSMDWVVLDDASRVLAVACMLIASRNNGRVPADPHYMKRVAYLNSLPKFKPLIDCGFLENLQADASVLQADARPETETYSKETEKESKSRGTRFALAQLPDDWKQECLKIRPSLNPTETFNSFRDYWIALPGQKGVKLDWMATWRNWVRKEKVAMAPNLP